jgi:hypothetical protein
MSLPIQEQVEFDNIIRDLDRIFGVCKILVDENPMQLSDQLSLAKAVMNLSQSTRDDLRTSIEQYNDLQRKPFSSKEDTFKLKTYTYQLVLSTYRRDILPKFQELTEKILDKENDIKAIADEKRAKGVSVSTPPEIERSLKEAKDEVASVTHEGTGEETFSDITSFAGRATPYVEKIIKAANIVVRAFSASPTPAQPIARSSTRMQTIIVERKPTDNREPDAEVQLIERTVNQRKDLPTSRQSAEREFMRDISMRMYSIKGILTLLSTNVESLVRKKKSEEMIEELAYSYRQSTVWLFQREYTTLKDNITKYFPNSVSSDKFESLATTTTELELCLKSIVPSIDRIVSVMESVAGQFDDLAKLVFDDIYEDK